MTSSIVAETLSPILSDMRLTGGVFLDAEFSAPWCIVSKVGPEDCQPFMVMPPYLIAYHYVIEGHLVAQVEGEAKIEAKTGQLLMLPRNDTHLLASDLGVAPADIEALIEPAETGNVARIVHGGGGARTRIFCGFLGTETGYDPLLSSLPAIISLALDADQTGKWVEESIRHLMRGLTAGGPSAARSMSRLAELLFVEAVREYVEQRPANERGWLSGLRDPLVGKALALIHGQLNRRWTLSDLARETATSRSVLTGRFSHLIGMAPIEYHRRRRLERAADSLSFTHRSIGSIALEAGYGSEAAFSRTFKKAYGSSPGAYRDATNHGR